MTRLLTAQPALTNAEDVLAEDSKGRRKLLLQIAVVAAIAPSVRTIGTPWCCRCSALSPPRRRKPPEAASTSHSNQLSNNRLSLLA